MKFDEEDKGVVPGELGGLGLLKDELPPAS